MNQSPRHTLTWLFTSACLVKSTLLSLEIPQIQNHQDHNLIRHSASKTKRQRTNKKKKTKNKPPEKIKGKEKDKK